MVYPGYSTWCIMDSTNFGYKSVYSMEKKSSMNVVFPFGSNLQY